MVDSLTSTPSESLDVGYNVNLSSWREKWVWPSLRGLSARRSPGWSSRSRVKTWRLLPAAVGCFAFLMKSSGRG